MHVARQYIAEGSGDQAQGCGIGGLPEVVAPLAAAVSLVNSDALQPARL